MGNFGGGPSKHLGLLPSDKMFYQIVEIIILFWLPLAIVV